MRRTDIALAVLVVLLAVGLIFGPPLVERWRAGDTAENAVVEPEPMPDIEAEPVEEVDNAALEEAAEAERVGGMLMLYQACANRIDGFDDRNRETLEQWKSLHADTLAGRGGEPDFHIVLADPEGLDRGETDKARSEELALCERNLEAMQADLAQTAGETPRVD